MENTMFVLELIGAAAFAVSGAMAAIKRHADIFGVLFLGVITALGGGVIRDVLLGQKQHTEDIRMALYRRHCKR